MKRNEWYKLAYSMLLSLLLCTQLIACSPITITVGQPAPTGTISNATDTPIAQESQIAQTVFDAINKDRAAAGLPSFSWSGALARSARQHNRAMMTASQLSHQLSGEPGLGDRERQQGIQWLQAAENIGVTNESSERGALRLHQAMMAERPPNDGHRQNILDAHSNQLGIDILFDSVHGELWLTEDFAEVLEAAFIRIGDAVAPPPARPVPPESVWHSRCGNT